MQLRPARGPTIDLTKSLPSTHKNPAPQKVYSIAVYVEGDRAAKELGIRSRGGFFEGDGDYCAALLDGAFGKALVVRGGGGREGRGLERGLGAGAWSGGLEGGVLRGATSCLPAHLAPRPTPGPQTPPHLTPPHTLPPRSSSCCAT
jgi:hypothetical protein